mmetsp:Transcript_12126/g.26071  ORF Transcript_12126/g.26071 Transcript_12126/m.26071 type:complete len:408 (+) Transcript_12126:327-1550(+)|eukprot:CAMPEP_0202893644 /NCGR_PEP_ID=MMETSP1392-20130828/3190_1 /ASSEMBLY_ACC=CAM_ASM_000868 /TAXON_ID=225041 /ORGANISM="Chlamydomonas chlamydogama, Strain SAG 11-48b" /LENGTH=407 /DNA_ID=CAMNT_0049578051 /DNA_START=313 /DNA_END=1536 /DNA_ORIENTATION=+
MSDLQPLSSVQEEEDRFERVSDAQSHAASSSGQTAHSIPARSITKEMILRALEKQGVRFPHSQADQAKVLAKQTHLHLNNLRIHNISNLQLLPQLEVCYLYDNCIQSPEGIGRLDYLTHLYLQNNEISEVRGLGSLVNLQKLYLQGNFIAHVSGLDGLVNLEELHLSNQHLPPGVGMTLDARSMQAVGSTLRVLSAVGCGIMDPVLDSLLCMQQLRKLELAQNQIQGFDHMEGMLRSAPRLMILDLRGNPVCNSSHKYRDTVVLMSDSLVSLDDVNITPQQREFLLRFHLQKMKQQMRAEQRQQQVEQPQQSQVPSSTGLGHSLPHAQPGRFTPPQPHGTASSLGQARAGAAGPPGRGYAGMAAAAAPVLSGSRGASRSPSMSKAASIPSKGHVGDLSLGMEGLQLR